MEIKTYYSPKWRASTDIPNLDEIYKGYSRIPPISHPSEAQVQLLKDVGYKLLAQGISFQDYGNRIMPFLAEHNPTKFLDALQVRAARANASWYDKQLFIDSTVKLLLEPHRSNYALDMEKYTLEMAATGMPLSENLIVKSETTREALRSLFTDLSQGKIDSAAATKNPRTAEFYQFTGMRGLQFLEGRIQALLDAATAKL